MAGMLIHYKKSCCNFSENQIEQYCCAAHTAFIVVKNIVQHLYALVRLNNIVRCRHNNFEPRGQRRGQQDMKTMSVQSC